MPLTMSDITFGSAHTSWVRCPSADDLGCGFHFPLSLGTRSIKRRLDLNSSSISFRNDWPIVTVALPLVGRRERWYGNSAIPPPHQLLVRSVGANSGADSPFQVGVTSVT